MLWPQTRLCAELYRTRYRHRVLVGKRIGGDGYYPVVWCNTWNKIKFGQIEDISLITIQMIKSSNNGKSPILGFESDSLTDQRDLS